VHIYGHRGSPGFPRFGENTRTSFRKALAAGAAGFELDVRRCGDGTLVVVHDATIDRTTNGAGEVASLPYDQLARFDAGHGDSIPRLKDVLTEFAATCTIHVEIKESGLAMDVAEMVRQGGFVSTMIVSSFNNHDGENPSATGWDELASIRSIVPIALLSTCREVRGSDSQAVIDAAIHHGAGALHLNKNSVDADIVSLARSQGILVRVWTVNSPEDALHFLDLGVDAIFTDFPEACIRAMRGGHASRKRMRRGANSPPVPGAPSSRFKN
jgi:glycerophosphoryl diester phosphodiesterase